MKDTIGAAGYELVGGTAERFAELVKKETAKWGEVVRRTGSKVD